MKRIFALLITFSLFFIYGCAPSEGQNGKLDYEATKKMVVDILKTDEGKKAIEDVLSDSEVKESLVMEKSFVKETIEKSLTSEEAQKFWTKAFSDPKFGEAFAKSIKKEHEKLIKDLMKDPEYQKMMIEILKNPEMEKQILDVIKSQKYREQVQEVVKETFESPLFKAKMTELLIKGAEEIQKGQGQQQSGQSQEGGGGGEGGSQGG